MATVTIADIDNTVIDPATRPGVMTGRNSPGSVTEQVASLAERSRPSTAWKAAFAISVSATLMFFSLVGYLIATGVGVWGNNAPVFWGWPIVNFVFGSASVMQAH